jgi:hypothetical protein
MFQSVLLAIVVMQLCLVLVQSDDSEIGIMTGKTIAIVGMLIHGNLGDEMETLSLPKKLKKWGCTVHGYMNDQVRVPTAKRVDRKMTRHVEYLDRVIYHDVDYKNKTLWKQYDAIIVAPGPSSLYAIPVNTII